ncbi:hypothetical protein [Litorimonas sp.]|uniref:hypothetical protein n=1 Tax=Litorimonas sp. TaxID=1892381 RepID=UPI003A85B45F
MEEHCDQEHLKISGTNIDKLLTKEAGRPLLGDAQGKDGERLTPLILRKVKFIHKAVDTGIKDEKSRKIIVLGGNGVPVLKPRVNDRELRQVVEAEGDAAVQAATLNAGLQGPEFDETAGFLSNI